MRLRVSPTVIPPDKPVDHSNARAHLRPHLGTILARGSSADELHYTSQTATRFSTQCHPSHAALLWLTGAGRDLKLANSCLEFVVIRWFDRTCFHSSPLWFEDKPKSPLEGHPKFTVACRCQVLRPYLLDRTVHPAQTGCMTGLGNPKCGMPDASPTMKGVERINRFVDCHIDE